MLQMLQMEKLIKTLTLIAATPDSQLHDLPLLHRSLVPLLSAAASLYRLSLFLRENLFLRQQQLRLPVPVISVGNLTWGGNGKTPMTEFIALVMAEFGVSPLVLTRGYAGGDEAKMLHRHLSQASVRIGVGANRGAIAASMLARYGHMDSSLTFHKLLRPHRSKPGQENEKIGVVILDDGMQHRTLFRHVEIVMLNSLMPWGTNHLLPRGSLREPLSALGRADIVVIHHADLVHITGPSTLIFNIYSKIVQDASDDQTIRPYNGCIELHVSDTELKIIESTVQKESASVSIYFTRLTPSHFFEVKDLDSKLPLTIIKNIVVLCVSGIGFPDAFVQAIKMVCGVMHQKMSQHALVENFRLNVHGKCNLIAIGPLHVGSLDFSDHHRLQSDDIHLIRERVEELQIWFQTKAIVVVTEKDYDRGPFILKKQGDLTILVLCSSIQFIPLDNHSEEDFIMKLNRLLIDKYEWHG